MRLFLISLVGCVLVLTGCQFSPVTLPGPESEASASSIFGNEGVGQIGAVSEPFTTAGGDEIRVIRTASDTVEIIGPVAGLQIVVQDKPSDIEIMERSFLGALWDEVSQAFLSVPDEEVAPVATAVVASSGSTTEEPAAPLVFEMVDDANTRMANSPIISISEPFVTADNDVLRALRISPNRTIVVGPNTIPGEEIVIVVDGEQGDVDVDVVASWADWVNKGKAIIIAVGGFLAELEQEGGNSCQVPEESGNSSGDTTGDTTGDINIEININNNISGDGNTVNNNNNTSVSLGCGND